MDELEKKKYECRSKNTKIKKCYHQPKKYGGGWGGPIYDEFGNVLFASRPIIKMGYEVIYENWIGKYAYDSIGKCKLENAIMTYYGNIIINKDRDKLSVGGEGFFAKIEGSLDIRNTKIEELPGNLFNVCGALRIDYTPLAKRVLNNDLKERERKLINKTTVWMF